MKSLVAWTPQVPVKQITTEVKKMLKGSDWKTAREVQALGKVGQRKAEVTGIKDYIKVLKQTALRAERRMGEILRDMEKYKGAFVTFIVHNNREVAEHETTVEKGRKWKWRKFHMPQRVRIC